MLKARIYVLEEGLRKCASCRGSPASVFTTAQTALSAALATPAQPQPAKYVGPGSDELVAGAETRFAELTGNDRGWQWRGFYNGFLEGFAWTVTHRENAMRAESEGGK
jgi:hypothetical protein